LIASKQLTDAYFFRIHSVAGIVGAERYGVAPDANLINVKVIGRGGDGGRIAQAILHVAAEHRANKAAAAASDDPWKFRGSIINMSLTAVSTLYTFLYHVQEANESGVAVFAAAGNSDKNAFYTYPCAVPAVKCVAAVNATYQKASFSNFGLAVDYIAPGVKILSLGIKHDTEIVEMSGTSMACPHAVGVAAIFASVCVVGPCSFQSLLQVEANSTLLCSSKASSAIKWAAS
jgi:subtilisin family serine protease